ncbi:alkaline phosphatase family protein [Galbibacter orientalis]|nr:alkaline phosphatase family protein [Galbibacter orientalis]
MKFKKIIFMVTTSLLGLWSCHNNSTENREIKHVVVIGFDGLSPDGIRNASTPNFDKVIAEGASTMRARAVLPTSSSSNWASMIMGASPSQHGITSNAWNKDNFELPTVVQGEDFLFPTVFNLINKQKENTEIGAIYHWSDFGRLFEKSAVNFDIHADTEEQTAAVASSYIKNKKPTFTFIHFDHIDHAGHEYGHGTPEYYESVTKGDKLLGEVLSAIKKAGILENTLVIISSDHGGVGKGHGGESLAEIEIPFIAWGKSVKKGYEIKTPVYQYDNAATVAYALGVKTPTAWIGKPVLSLFEGNEIKGDEYLIEDRLVAPIIKPEASLNKRAGGLFFNETKLEIINPNKEGVIRYTLDGSMPTKKSTVYEGIIDITDNKVVKAAIFLEGKISSPLSEAFFRIRHDDRKRVSYKIYYLVNLTSLPELFNKTPDDSGNTYEITSEEIKEKIKENTAVIYTAIIDIKKAANYTFYTRSDDGSKLWIDNELVVANDGDHGVLEKSGTVKLNAGEHAIKVAWFNGGGDGWLDVYYKDGKSPKQLVSTELLN